MLPDTYCMRIDDYDTFETQDDHKTRCAKQPHVLLGTLIQRAQQAHHFNQAKIRHTSSFLMDIRQTGRPVLLESSLTTVTLLIGDMAVTLQMDCAVSPPGAK